MADETQEAPITDSDWANAAARVQELKQEYDRLVGMRGINVTFALAHINRDLTRYAQGERTHELYEELLSKK